VLCSAVDRAASTKLHQAACRHQDESSARKGPFERTARREQGTVGRRVVAADSVENVMGRGGREASQRKASCERVGKARMRWARYDERGGSDGLEGSRAVRFERWREAKKSREGEIEMPRRAYLRYHWTPSRERRILR
jgi:hypothetical protein